MKKTSFILAGMAGAALLAMTGCDLEIRDPYVAPPVETINVGLGGENTLNVTKVTIDGVEQADKVKSALKPSGWNAISEFDTVKLGSGSTVEFTFKQPTKGVNAWETWALAISDDNNAGQFLRADNWLNTSTDAGFTTGKWCAGGVTAAGTYKNGFTYVTCGSTLSTDATVVVSVTLDNNDV